MSLLAALLLLKEDCHARFACVCPWKQQETHLSLPRASVTQQPPFIQCVL